MYQMQTILLPQGKVLRDAVYFLQFTGLDNVKVLLYKIIHPEKEGGNHVTEFMWVLNSPSYCFPSSAVFAADARMKPSFYPWILCLVVLA
jgi:hypothetical protein